MAGDKKVVIKQGQDQSPPENPMSASTTPSCDFPRRFPFRLLPLVTSLLLLACLMFRHSEFVWDGIYSSIRSMPIKATLEVCNNFATETVYFVVGVMIWLYDPPRRRTLPILVFALLATSSVTQLGKQTTGRARPTYGVRLGVTEIAWTQKYIAAHPDSKLALEPGDHWYWFESRPFRNDEFKSFPSGHSAGAVVLATYLSILYARASWLWYGLAVLCGMARIEKRRHYPEDVIFGWCIGFLVSSLIFASPWAVRWADGFSAWLEARLVRCFGQRASGVIPLPSRLIPTE